MTNPFLRNNNIIKLKKAIAAVLAIAFLFDDTVFASEFQNLARPGLQIPEVKYRMEGAYDLISNEKLKDDIRSAVRVAGGLKNISKRNDSMSKDGEKTDITILEIPHLIVPMHYFSSLDFIDPVFADGFDLTGPVIVTDRKHFYNEEKPRKDAKFPVWVHSNTGQTIASEKSPGEGWVHYTNLLQITHPHLTKERRDGDAADGQTDFTIAGNGWKDMTRRGHELFHGNLSTQITAIAAELDIEARKLGIKPLKYKHRGEIMHDGIREIVEAILDKTGKVKVELPNRVKIWVEDGILIIMNPDFEVNHAGRNEMAVYARYERGIVHEREELTLWRNYSLNPANGIVPKGVAGLPENAWMIRLGDYIIKWANKKGDGLEQADNRSKAEELRRRFHQMACKAEFKYVLDQTPGISDEIRELALTKIGSRLPAVEYLMENCANINIMRSYHGSDDGNLLFISPIVKRFIISENCLRKHSSQWIEHRILTYAHYRSILGYFDNLEYNVAAEITAETRAMSILAKNCKPNEGGEREYFPLDLMADLATCQDDISSAWGADQELKLLNVLRSRFRSRLSEKKERDELDSITDKAINVIRARMSSQLDERLKEEERDQEILSSDLFDPFIKTKREDAGFWSDSSPNEVPQLRPQSNKGSVNYNGQDSLKERREAFRLTLQDISKATDISRTTIHRYENGYRPTPLYAISLINKAIDNLQASRLQERRKNAHLTVRELAVGAGMGNDLLMGLEEGKVSAAPDAWRQLDKNIMRLAGVKLRARRGAARMSQQGLAILAESSNVNISEFETGNKPVSEKDLARFHKIIDGFQTEYLRMRLESARLSLKEIAHEAKLNLNLFKRLLSGEALNNIKALNRAHQAIDCLTGKRLRERREAARISIGKIASTAEIDMQLINKVELGRLTYSDPRNLNKIPEMVRKCHAAIDKLQREHLTRRREAARLTQNEIAAAIGYNRSYLNSIESGAKRGTPEIYKKAHEAIDRLQGVRLKERREAARIPRSLITARMGLDASSILKIEKGGSISLPKYIAKIHKVIDELQGARLRERRTSSRLSLEEVSSYAAISNGIVSRMERGQILSNYSLLSKLHEAIDKLQGPKLQERRESAGLFKIQVMALSRVDYWTIMTMEGRIKRRLKEKKGVPLRRRENISALWNRVHEAIESEKPRSMWLIIPAKGLYDIGTRKGEPVAELISREEGAERQQEDREQREKMLGLMPQVTDQTVRSILSLTMDGKGPSEISKELRLKPATIEKKLLEGIDQIRALLNLVPIEELHSESVAPEIMMRKPGTSHNYMEDVDEPNVLPDKDGIANVTGPQLRPQPQAAPAAEAVEDEGRVSPPKMAPEQHGGVLSGRASSADMAAAPDEVVVGRSLQEPEEFIKWFLGWVRAEKPTNRAQNAVINQYVDSMAPKVLAMHEALKGVESVPEQIEKWLRANGIRHEWGFWLVRNIETGKLRVIFDVMAPGTGAGYGTYGGGDFAPNLLSTYMMLRLVDYRTETIVRSGHTHLFSHGELIISDDDYTSGMIEYGAADERNRSILVYRTGYPIPLVEVTSLLITGQEPSSISPSMKQEILKEPLSKGWAEDRTYYRGRSYYSGPHGIIRPAYHLCRLFNENNFADRDGALALEVGPGSGETRSKLQRLNISIDGTTMRLADIWKLPDTEKAKLKSRIAAILTERLPEHNRDRNIDIVVRYIISNEKATDVAESLGLSAIYIYKIVQRCVAKINRENRNSAQSQEGTSSSASTESANDSAASLQSSDAAAEETGKIEPSPLSFPLSFGGQARSTKRAESMKPEGGKNLIMAAPPAKFLQNDSVGPNLAMNEATSTRGLVNRFSSHGYAPSNSGSSDENWISKRTEDERKDAEDYGNVAASWGMTSEEFDRFYKSGSSHLDGIDKVTAAINQQARGVEKYRYVKNNDLSPEEVLPEKGAIYHSTYLGAISLMISESGGQVFSPFFALFRGRAVAISKRFEDDLSVKNTDTITLAFDVQRLRKCPIKFNIHNGIDLRTYNGVLLSALTDDSKRELARKLIQTGKDHPKFALPLDKIAVALGYDNWKDFAKSLAFSRSPRSTMRKPGEPHKFMKDADEPNVLPDKDGIANVTGPQLRPQPDEPSPDTRLDVMESNTIINELSNILESLESAEPDSQNLSEIEKKIGSLLFRLKPELRVRLDLRNLKSRIEHDSKRGPVYWSADCVKRKDDHAIVQQFQLFGTMNVRGLRDNATLLGLGKTFMALGGDFYDQEMSFSPSNKDESTGIFSANINFSDLSQNPQQFQIKTSYKNPVQVLALHTVTFALLYADYLNRLQKHAGELTVEEGNHSGLSSAEKAHINDKIAEGMKLSPSSGLEKYVVTLRPEIERDSRVLDYLLYDMNPCINALKTELHCLEGAITEFLPGREILVFTAWLNEIAPRIKGQDIVRIYFLINTLGWLPIYVKQVDAKNPLTLEFVASLMKSFERESHIWSVGDYELYKLAKVIQESSEYLKGHLRGEDEKLNQALMRLDAMIAEFSNTSSMWQKSSAMRKPGEPHKFMKDAEEPNALPDKDGIANVTGPQLRPQPDAAVAQDGPRFDLTVDPESLFPVKMISDIITGQGKRADLRIEKIVSTEKEIHYKLMNMDELIAQIHIINERGLEMESVSGEPLRQDLSFLTTPQTSYIVKDKRQVRFEVELRQYSGLKPRAEIVYFELVPLKKLGIGTMWYVGHIEPYLRQCGFDIVSVNGRCIDDPRVHNFYVDRGFTINVPLNYAMSDEETERSIALKILTPDKVVVAGNMPESVCPAEGVSAATDNKVSISGRPLGQSAKLHMGERIMAFLARRFEEDIRKQILLMIESFLKSEYEPAKEVFARIDPLTDEEKVKRARELLVDDEIIKETLSNSLSPEQVLGLEPVSDTAAIYHIFNRFLLPFSEDHDAYKEIYESEPEVLKYDQKRWELVYSILCAAEILEKNGVADKVVSGEGAFAKDVQNDAFLDSAKTIDEAVDIILNGKGITVERLAPTKGAWKSGVLSEAIRNTGRQYLVKQMGVAKYIVGVPEKMETEHNFLLDLQIRVIAGNNSVMVLALKKDDPRYGAIISRLVENSAVPVESDAARSAKRVGDERDPKDDISGKRFATGYKSDTIKTSIGDKLTEPTSRTRTAEELLSRLDNADADKRLSLKKQIISLGRSAIDDLVFAVGHPPPHASDCACSALAEIAKVFPREVDTAIRRRLVRYPKNSRLIDLLESLSVVGSKIQFPAVNGVAPDAVSEARKARIMSAPVSEIPETDRGISYYEHMLAINNIIDELQEQYIRLVDKGVLNPGEEMNVLDIGCGTGKFLIELNGMLKDKQFSSGMKIKLCGLALKGSTDWTGREAYITFKRGYAELMPDEWSGEFHYIVSVHTIGYSRDELAFVEGVHRALAPYGIARIHSVSATPVEYAGGWDKLFKEMKTLGGYNLYTAPPGRRLPVLIIERGPPGEPDLHFPYTIDADGSLVHEGNARSAGAEEENRRGVGAAFYNDDAFSEKLPERNEPVPVARRHGAWENSVIKLFPNEDWETTRAILSAYEGWEKLPETVYSVVRQRLDDMDIDNLAVDCLKRQNRASYFALLEVTRALAEYRLQCIIKIYGLRIDGIDKGSIPYEEVLQTCLERYNGKKPFIKYLRSSLHHFVYRYAVNKPLRRHEKNIARAGKDEALNPGEASIDDSSLELYLALQKRASPLTQQDKEELYGLLMNEINTGARTKIRRNLNIFEKVCIDGMARAEMSKLYCITRERVGQVVFQVWRKIAARKKLRRAFEDAGFNVDRLANRREFAAGASYHFANDNEEFGLIRKALSLSVDDYAFILSVGKTRRLSVESFRTWLSRDGIPVPKATIGRARHIYAENAPFCLENLRKRRELALEEFAVELNRLKLSKKVSVEELKAMESGAKPVDPILLVRARDLDRAASGDFMKRSRKILEMSRREFAIAIGDNIFLPEHAVYEMEIGHTVIPDRVMFKIQELMKIGRIDKGPTVGELRPTTKKELRAIGHALGLTAVAYVKILHDGVIPARSKYTIESYIHGAIMPSKAVMEFARRLYDEKSPLCLENLMRRRNLSCEELANELNKSGLSVEISGQQLEDMVLHKIRIPSEVLITGNKIDRKECGRYMQYLFAQYGLKGRQLGISKSLFYSMRIGERVIPDHIMIRAQQAAGIDMKRYGITEDPQPAAEESAEVASAVVTSQALTIIRDGAGPGGLLEQALGGGVKIGPDVAGILESVGVFEKIEIASSADTIQQPPRNDEDTRYRFTAMIRGESAADTQNRINVVNHVMSKEKDVSREILKAHIIDYAYKQTDETIAPEKTYTIRAWKGYAAPSQAGLLTEIRKMTQDKQCRISFEDIGELVSFACDNVNEETVTMLPLNILNVDQVASLNKARVIYINLEDQNIGSDNLINLQGLIGIGRAYLNNDGESFYRLYRLLAKDPISENVKLAILKANPILFIDRLRFILKPVVAKDPQELRRIKDSMEELLKAA